MNPLAAILKLNPLTVFNETAYIYGDIEFVTVFAQSKFTEYKNSKKLVTDLPKLLKNVKTAIVTVFSYKGEGYETNIDFCKALKEKLDSLKIQSFFDSIKNYTASTMLYFANVNIQFGDTVFMVVAFKETVCITVYEYTKDGYKELSEEDIVVDANENPKSVHAKIIGSSNPKKIILACKDGSNAVMKLLRTALKSKKLVAYSEFPIASESFIAEIIKWMSDRSYTKYHIIPKCVRQYFLMSSIDGEIIQLLSIEKDEEFLPYTKDFYLSNCYESYVYGDVDEEASLHAIPLWQKYHHAKITVSIDVENFLRIEHETITYPEVKALLKTLEKMDKKIPVIGIFKEMSVICEYKNGKYDFMDDWNGLYGKELAISFDEEQPKFFENALKVLLEKSSSVVRDLFKIMSMPINKIEVDEKWGFAITKDETNPVLLEFDNFDGTQKLASPAFLMALLLKQHLKIIKEKSGQKPAEIGFALLDKWNENERKRVENGLKEACKLLKIECVKVCIF